MSLICPEEEEAAPPPHALFLSAARLQEQAKRTLPIADSGTALNTSSSSANAPHCPSVVFHQRDLPGSSFPVMEDIRRMGKLCDVTIKVRSIERTLSYFVQSLCE